MSDDYEVGYKKPPRHAQFKRGQSGNLRGRPKGTKNLRTDLEEELQEAVIVKEGETRKSVSKQRAMVKSLMAKAMQGDTRAANTILNMIFRLLDLGDNRPDGEELGADDLQILQDYENRVRASNGRAVEPEEAARRGPRSPEGGAVADS